MFLRYFLIFILLLPQLSYAHEKGDIIHLSDEAKFALRTDFDVQLVRHLDTLKGGIDVWASAPLSDDDLFHPLRILYFFEDGRMLVGNMFDKDMNMLTLKYNKALRDEVDRKVFKLDESLEFTFGDPNGKWHQNILVFGGTDKWVNFVRLFNELNSEQTVLSKVPFSIFYRPTGDLAHASDTSLAWVTTGEHFRNIVMQNDYKLQIKQYANQASSRAKNRLGVVLSDSAEMLDMLGLNTMLDYAVYNGRTLLITDEITKDDIVKLIFGYKPEQLGRKF